MRGSLVAVRRLASWPFRPARAAPPPGRRWAGCCARLRSCSASTRATATRSRSGRYWADEPMVLFSSPDAVREIFRARSGRRAGRAELGVPAPVRRRPLDPRARRRRAPARAAAAAAPVPRRAHAGVRGDRRRAGRGRGGAWSGRVVALERMRQLTLEVILRVGVRRARRGARSRAARRGRTRTLDTVRSMPRMLAMALVQRDLGPRSPWGRFRARGRALRRAAARRSWRRRRAQPGGRLRARAAARAARRGGQPADRPPPARPARGAARRRPRHLGGVAGVGVRAAGPPPRGPGAPARGRRPRLSRRRQSRRCCARAPR